MDNKISSAKRFIGSVQSVDSKNGKFQKIVMSNLSPENQDGTANKYYKGALVWIDAETGKTYQVKQLAISVPKDGMSDGQAKHGFESNISINLNDEYQAVVLD